MAVPNKHGGAAVSIYFTDVKLIQRIEDLGKICNVSASRIIEQVMSSSMKQLEEVAPTKRIFKIESIFVKL